MEKNELRIIGLLSKNKLGLSITDLVRESKLSRSTIRTNLARLEGRNKIKFRQVGMAKLYILK